MIYWIYTKWACGGIKVEKGIVVSGAPIFKRLIGQRLQELQRIYKVKGPL